MQKNPITTLAVIGIVCFALGFVLGALARKKYYPCTEVTIPTITRDTITVTDTLKFGYPVPEKVEVIRFDTIRVRVSPFGMDSVKVKTERSPSVSSTNLGATDQAIKDAKPKGNANVPVNPRSTAEGPTLTPGGNLAIPIERKTYQAEEYKAVVEGWRPQLISMEVYPKTLTVTKTETLIQKKRPLWALVVGPGVGYGLEGKIAPGINATLGLVLISK